MQRLAAQYTQYIVAMLHCGMAYTHLYFSVRKFVQTDQ
jgi:hypothetical protein